MHGVALSVIRAVVTVHVVSELFRPNLNLL